MQKRILLIATFGISIVAGTMLPVAASTVAYWPLAYENGVRTTTATVFANQGNGGTLNAVPSSRSGASWISSNDYCPQGTNAFPAGYGVYDPVSGTNAAAATGLYFHKISLNGNAGALRVADPAALRLKTFTVECFVRMQPGTSQNEWNCIAVMPGQLKNGSTTIKNCDSWGLRVIANNKMSVRFTKSGYTVNGEVISGTNKAIEFFTTGIYDGRWHHVAFSVNDDTKKVMAFFDYALSNEGSLDESVWYNSGEDLFIGNTPQTAGPFGGSIAHFRISDKALDPPDFLHFTRTERAADEDPDVLLHLDFEPPTGLATTQGFFNDAAVGSAVHHWGAQTIPQTIAAATPFSTVYSSLLDETGRVSAFCMTNATGYRSTGEIVKRYVAWQPPEDVFSNSSFTVECCYKTAGQLGSYIPLVRRLGGYNVQFNIGFGGGGNVGKLTAATVPGATGSTVSIIDTIRTDDGQWHHAAVVFDRARGTMTLFRDYEPVSSPTYTGVVAPTNTPIYIGGGYDNTGAYKPYDGLIDNVRITMRALTVGEFLRPDHAMLSGKTLAWASFDNTLNASPPAYALTNGIASAAATGGTVPSFDALSAGERIEDGNGNVLRNENLAVLSCSTGVVKYADNLLLPLVKDQTIEFRIKADPQTKFAGIVRCNLYRNAASIPVWGLSGGELDSRVLRFRCALVGASYFEEAGMNEDTGVVAFDGKWHHIALTLSQSDGKVTASIYKDYEDTPSWTKTKAGRLCYGTGYAPVWIGASSSTTAFFNGQIDELRISRGILAPTEFLRRGTLPFVMMIK